MGFGSDLQRAMDARGPLCVGIDPHPELLLQWGLEDSPKSLLTFGERVLSAAQGTAAAVKPQMAFFERHGSRGLESLEVLLEMARELGLLTIMDVKRGDIGSTMDAYADAYLAAGAPLECDAITASPYLGVGSLAPAFELARVTGKGVFVLALTSNPEGASVQHARAADGRSVAAHVVDAVAELNAGEDGMGNFGLVVGATIGDAVATLGIDLASVNGPLLSPGVGAQGATARDVAKVFGDARRLVLVSQSRGVLTMGPHVEELRGAIVRAAQSATSILHTNEGQLI